MGKNPKLTRVCDVMTPNPSCVASNASAIDALKKMVSGQFRHLPVTDNEKGWCMVSYLQLSTESGH